jgi:hypothetical protein
MQNGSYTEKYKTPTAAYHCAAELSSSATEERTIQIQLRMRSSNITKFCQGRETDRAI